MFNIGMQEMLVVGFIGGIGMQELMVVAFIALLLFGHRLPSMMRSLGSGVTEFKKGMTGVDEEPKEETKA